MKILNHRKSTSSTPGYFDLSNENILTYKRNIKKHDINVVAAFSNQYTNTSFFSAQAGNFATDDIPTLNAGTQQALTNTIEEEPLVSYLARVNYAYDNKYLLSLSNRYDGSGRFGPESRLQADGQSASLLHRRAEQEDRNYSF